MKCAVWTQCSRLYRQCDKVFCSQGPSFSSGRPSLCLLSSAISLWSVVSTCCWKAANNDALLRRCIPRRSKTKSKLTPTRKKKQTCTENMDNRKRGQDKRPSHSRSAPSVGTFRLVPQSRHQILPLVFGLSAEHRPQKGFGLSELFWVPSGSSFGGVSVYLSFFLSQCSSPVSKTGLGSVKSHVCLTSRFGVSPHWTCW